ncbi:unnamed protein product [Closterium sp. NIES-65]|nr:unnamed protein product [Closterium sp. NIES-65]
MIIDIAHTSMIHADAPHFLWLFVVEYVAHQINLQPRVSLPDASPTLWWTGKVGDASAFRVWGSRAIVRDLYADKLSPRAVPDVFLGFPPDAPGWQFYHPTSRHGLSSQGVTFDESVPYYRLFPYRTAPLPSPPLFLAPSPSPVDPLPPQGPSPSGVSQVDAVEPVKVAVDSSTARGAESLGVLSLWVRSLGVLGVLVWPLAVLGLGTLRVPRQSGSYPLRRSCASGFPGAGAVLQEVEVLLLLLTLGLALKLLEPVVLEELVLAVLELLGLGGGAETAGADAAGARATGGVGAGGAASAGASEGAGVGAVGAGGAAGAGAAAGGTGAIPAGSRGAARPRPYFIPLTEQVLARLPPTCSFSLHWSHWRSC